MRLCWYFLGAMLAFESESTKSYGSPSVRYSNTPVNEQNLLCNGDFEDPPVLNEKKWDNFTNTDIPCWSGTKNQIEFGIGGVYVDGMQTQVMELATDTKTLNQGFKQMVNLTKGTYTLKFDYAARQDVPPESSMFVIYFNGKEVAKFRPGAYGIQTEELEVEGKDGDNIVEFVDASSVPGRGALIDNVGLYAWKKNQLTAKEIEAVSAGGIVTMSSIWDTNFDMYQLDRPYDGAGLNIGGWCPRNTINGQEWIQVSTDTLKLWNSVIIQGRSNVRYITKFKLMYTTDGFAFKDVENGKTFSGNTNGSTKIRHNFEPFYAIAIRLVPMGYYGHICLRWGATYIVEE